MDTPNDITAREKRLRRVALVSGVNGWSIVGATILFGIISLLLSDWLGAVLCLMAFSAGAMELRGRRELRGRPDKAKQWLTLSQGWLFGIIVSYAAYQLISLDLAPDLQALPPELQQAMSQLMPLDAHSFEAILKQIYQLIYLTLIGVSFLYQGGLFWFYQKNLSKLLSAGPK